MTQTRLVLERQWPVWALVLVALITLGSVVGFYFRNRRALTAGYFALLLGLRLAAVSLLVLLVFRPQIVVERRFSERPALAFLIDASGSMSVQDAAGGPSRLSLVQRTLRPESPVMQGLARDFDVTYHAFCSRDSVRPTDLTPAGLQRVKADGPFTGLALGVLDLAARQRDERLLGVVLFSDGVDNSGTDPVKEIRARGIPPIHTVVVGERLSTSEDFKDIAVLKVDHERYVTVGHEVEIEVYLDVRGYAHHVIPVTLTANDKTVWSKPIEMQSGSQRITIPFTPERTGYLACRVSIPKQPEERIERNNSRRFLLIVTDPRIRVLYLEGKPRWEYKHLIRTLQEDVNVEILSLIRIAPDTFLRQGEIEGVTLDHFPKDDEAAALEPFNVFIFGDIDRSALTTKQLTNVAAAVRASSKKGILMIGGPRALGAGGYGDSPLAAILPAQLGDRTVGTVKPPFPLTLTGEGETHPIFSGIVPYFPTRRRPAKQALPPLGGANRVVGKTPIATVLAVHPTEQGAEGRPLPIALVGPAGQGRAMIFAADTTWQWYFELKGLGRDSPYARFWRQAIRWLAGQEIKEEGAERGITVRTDRPEYEPGDTVKVYARAWSGRNEPTNRAEINVTITTPEEEVRRLSLSHQPGSAGEYMEVFPPDLPGEYQLSAKATLDGGPLGKEEKLKFHVGKPSLEFEQLDADEQTMQAIAEATHGRTCSLVHFRSLVEGLQGQRRERETRQTYRLWSPFWFFALFLGLISLEWTLRRRKQLV